MGGSAVRALCFGQASTTRGRRSDFTSLQASASRTDSSSPIFLQR